MNNRIPQINELFADWVDFDIAEYYIACLIGLVKFDSNYDEFRRTKGVYNSKNDVGDMLYLFLEKLADVKVLERGGDGYRWNHSFDAHWLNSELKESRK